MARRCVPMQFAALAVLIAAGSPAAAQMRLPTVESPRSRLNELPIRSALPNIIHAGPGSLPNPTDCAQISTHTDFNFSSGGTAFIQAGFAQGEIAAASYTLTAADFPLRINTAEILFATEATITTTTRWTVMVWQGTPMSGSLIYSESSDGQFLPHIVITPPGNNALLIFQWDPGDPLTIQNNGSNTFTIGFRIDQHNNQTQNPCTTAPPANSNAFPTTDTSGLASPSGNLLFGLNCGSFGCPPNGGWTTFANLNILCRPSGDWVMRATWEPVNCGPTQGACCTNGVCQIMTQPDCLSQSGSYQGDNTNCTSNPCPNPTGACCTAGTNCLQLSQGDCAIAGGVWQGANTSCSAGNQCPIGACCLPDGSCLSDVSIATCTSQQGTFRGVGTTCANPCPQPTGACCLSNGGCLTLTLSDCNLIPGTWAGAATTCPTTNCQAVICYPNCDGSTEPPILNIADFSCFLQKFAAADPYANCDGSTQEPILNVADFSCFLSKFAAGCP
jgi:hypothetical protein